jgi:hypothetical protein
MAQLGVDVGAIFGQGLLPVEPLSVPWKVMKNSYVATFGKTAGDRSSATDDLLNALGAVFVPQFRYGSKVVKAAVDLERGYKAAGSKQLEVMEMSPIVAIMDLTGFPMTGTKATWDLYSQMRDQAYEYGEAKQKLVLRGIKALDKGKMDEIQKVFLEAQDKKVVLTYSELAKYYRMNKTKTYLQSQLDKLPKHLRPAMQAKITELEQELMPHRFGKGTGEVADRSMWSSSARADEEE